MSRFSFNNKPKDKPYIEFFAENIGAKIKDGYLVEADNDYFNGVSVILDHFKNIRIIAHKHFNKKDYTVTLSNDKEFDFTIICFENNVLYDNGKVKFEFGIPNGFVLLKGTESVRLSYKENTLKNSVVCHFNRKRLGDDILEIVDRTNSFFYHTGNENMINWKLSLSDSARKLIHDKYKKQWIFGKINELAIIIKSIFYSAEDSFVNSIFQDNEIESAYLIKDNIEKNLKEKPKLEELAKKYGINKNRLTTIFKDLFNITIYKYYKEQRILKAKEEILHTNKTLGQIANEYGFSDIGHLSKSILEKFGITATELRKK
ncbi:helix-turn-helix domain-containing protein [Flammeovirga sp. SubArs3]|uniref:helix-turn-helix transcriptional regulator n=1 Tax=Flammeovirga sp. SubArs3 TaxID=2995316 RepID=UPI00248C1016|nr:helix-turn-helix domain-containing protein [Flammeovirga sp. SubArs3]